MRVRLLCDGTEASVTPFVERILGSVCLATAASLKAPAATKGVRYELQGDAVRLHLDGAAVPLGLNQGFAAIIIRDTLRGMLQHLKGVRMDGNILIIVELGGQP